MNTVQTADKVTPISVQPARYVTVKLASAVTGLTKAAIRTKISRGIWVDGRQYVKREGTVFIDLKGYERWVELGAA